MLTGIAKCGVCDDGLRYRAKAGRKPYYACHNGHVSRLVEMLDSAVISALFKRLQDVDPSQYESGGPDDDAIQAEIDKLEGDLAEWEAKAIASEVSPGAFGRIEQGLRERIDALEAKRTGPTDLVFDPTLWPELSVSGRGGLSAPTWSGCAEAREACACRAWRRTYQAALAVTALGRNSFRASNHCSRVSGLLAACGLGVLMPA